MRYYQGDETGLLRLELEVEYQQFRIELRDERERRLSVGIELLDHDKMIEWMQGEIERGAAKRHGVDGGIIKEAVTHD